MGDEKQKPDDKPGSDKPGPAGGQKQGEQQGSGGKDERRDETSRR